MINELAKGLFGRMKPQAQSSAWSDEEADGETNAGEEQDVGWVTVLVVWDSADAVVIVARLQDESIPALARPQAASSAIPVTVGMLSEIEILVPEAMADRAIDVLWDLGLLTEQDESGEYEEDQYDDGTTDQTQNTDYTD